MEYSSRHEDRTYEALLAKMHEVSSLTPQSVGPFSPAYHQVIPYFKRAPWRMFAAGSFAITIMLYLLFGVAIVKLVTVLQYGF